MIDADSGIEKCRLTKNIVTKVAADYAAIFMLSSSCPLTKV